jgi:hypothetical protein
LPSAPARHSSTRPEGLFDDSSAGIGHKPTFRTLASLAAAQKTFTNAQLGSLFVSAEERRLPALNRYGCLVDGY